MKVQGFIATQGPLPDTIPDFWRLVWEQNGRTIVMLTNPQVIQHHLSVCHINLCVCVCLQERMKTKCEVYWPREVGCSVVYGGIEVTLTDLTQLADFTIRCLTINKVLPGTRTTHTHTHTHTLSQAGSGKEGREVRQFHFTSWPDHGVPQYATAMLAMVRRVLAFHTSDTGPMVVHCSAGTTPHHLLSLIHTHSPTHPLTPLAHSLSLSLTCRGGTNRDIHRHLQHDRENEGKQEHCRYIWPRQFASNTEKLHGPD